MLQAHRPYLNKSRRAENISSFLGHLDRLCCDAHMSMVLSSNHRFACIAMPKLQSSTVAEVDVSASTSRCSRHIAICEHCRLELQLCKVLLSGHSWYNLNCI